MYSSQLQLLLNRTKELMQIPSTKGNLEAREQVLMLAASIVDTSLTRRDFTHNNVKSILFSNRPENVSEFSIVMNAHLDVVPAEPEAFIPVERNGKLFGRGAYDMKSGSAVMISLFSELAKEVSYPLALQLTTDEEVGGMDGTGYQIKEGIKADFAITGEGTNLDIKHEAKGVIWMKLISHGISNHSAYPWRGKNAFISLLKVLEKIFAKYPLPEEEAWKTVVNIAKLETPNNTYNRIPEEAYVMLDIRAIPEDFENILPTIKTFLPPEITLEVLFHQPSISIAKDNPYVRLLQDVTEKNSGQRPSLIGAHAASDIRFFNYTGSDGIEFGPIGKNHHGKGEWVDIASIEAYYQSLKQFLLKVEKMK